MRQINIQTDLVIIGDGIAALSLAYVAGQNGLSSVVLGKNIPGATNSATGFLAPRPDYILRDRELVQRTAHECNRWRQMFSTQIVKPQLFLIPIGPQLPKSVRKFEALLDFYDRETRARLYQLPSGYFKVNQTALERMEPILRKNYFAGALALWEWTVDPEILLKNMRNKTEIDSASIKKILIKDASGFEVKNNCIQKIVVNDLSDRTISIGNERHPIIVVNATGSWIPDIWKFFGISLPIDLKIGVQAQVPGWYFNSGIITFGSDNKYVVCMQKDGYVQVGPTNGTSDIGYLSSTFSDIVNDPAPVANFLKSGSRVKSFMADTQRPVIWSHRNCGFDNLYSLHPGKMVLALLAADELLSKAKKDDWIERCVRIPDRNYALKGESRRYSDWKIRWLAFKSFTALASYYIYYLFKSKTP